ncbi:MAG: hypothetical protein R3F34_06545 [Planctomycetota bacterium]
MQSTETLVRRSTSRDLAPVPDGFRVGPPDFVGVGCGRSGSTWWCDLLSRHEDVVPNRVGLEELHFLDHSGRSAPSDEEIELSRSAFAPPVARRRGVEPGGVPERPATPSPSGASRRQARRRAYLKARAAPTDPAAMSDEVHLHESARDASREDVTVPADLLGRSDGPREGHEFLFSRPSTVPLLVSCNCPSTLCNYRCSYCYLDHDGRDGAREDRAFKHWERTVDRIVRIPRPLYLAIGTEGEPLTVKPFWDVLRRLSQLENVRGFWFPTNLSRPIEKFAEGIDRRKLGLTASLHPSEFRDHDRDLASFLARASWVVEGGGDVVVNFILSPDQLDLYPAYRFIAREHGLASTVNVFKGEYRGKSYPEAYTEEDHEKIESYLADRPFVHHFMSGASSRGVQCHAGQDSIHVDPVLGTVENCPFAREPMGSIWDDRFQIRSRTTSCSTDWCKCHWTIGLMKDVAKRTKRTRSIFAYETRPEGQDGEHPFQ